MAKSTYAALDKDALIAEVKSRRDAGRTIKVDLRGDEDTLRKALETDDLTNGEVKQEAPQAPPPAPPEVKPTPAAEKASKPTGDLRNQVSAQPEVPTLATQPTDEEFAKGSLVRHRSDGLLYQAIRKGTDETRLIKARVPAQESGHSGYFWEGSEAEFAAVFEKA